MNFKALLFIGCIISGHAVQAQTTVNGSFSHDGVTRTYSFYVPANYSSANPVPLVLNLHGYTSNGAQQAAYGDFRPIADTANFIVVHPNGTNDPLTSQPFWNFGIFGATVDDYGFLEALIDTISSNYSINQSRIYSVGMSNGGFMSYGLACQSNRFAAVGSVTGSMSVPMYNSCTPAHPTPIIHIHGTDDNINPYTGNGTSKATEEVVEFWVNNNNCNTTPQITAVPNTNPTDGATAERYLYSGGTNGHTVEFFKVTGGGHTWPGAPIPIPTNGNTCMDFSASKEVWRFFSQYELSGEVSINNAIVEDFEIYPNPTTGILYIKSQQPINELLIIDLQGRVIGRIEGNNTTNNTYQLNLHHINSGNYFLELSGNHFKTVKKITLQ